MTITPLTRTDGSAGRRKEDARPIINLLKQLAAGEWNNIADAVIELQTEFNALTGGTTIVDEDFAGAFRGTLTRTGAGAYAARRDEISADPPDAGDDVADGFLPGSLWVQIAGYPGPYDGAPIHTLWFCNSNAAAAAEWVQVARPSDDLPLAAGTASAGVAERLARADHVHPSPASNDAPLANGVASPGTSLTLSRSDHVHPRSRDPIPVDFDASIVFQSISGVAAQAYTSIGGALVPRTTPWTIAFRVKPGASFGSFTTLVAKWSAIVGQSAWAITRWGNGLAFFLDDGTSVASPRAYTDDAIFSGTAEREICVVWDGSQTAFNRVKFYWRAVGGTWAAATMLFTVSPPATLRDVATSVSFAVPGVLEAQAPSMTLRDVRIWGAVIIPSGTADPTLTGLTSRWRFRALTLDRMSSPDEISGALMTLANQAGGRRRPTRVANAWNPGTPSGPKVLVIGDSKSADATDRPSTWRYEAANQIAAAYGISIDYVGRYTDTYAAVEFAGNAQHSALSGDLLSGGILTRCTADVITYAPDVVVIEGGTNDAFAGASATTIRDRMSACVDAVLAASATARVVVCSDPAIKSTVNLTENAVLAAYNALLPALVASKSPRVSFCDLYPLNHDADFVDNLHLNAIGCQRLGEELAVAIAAAL